MKALTPEQVESYRYNGFLSPFPVLTPDETAACLAGLQRFERFIGSAVPRADMHWRSLTHACLPFYADLARNPRILDVVEDLIGPDILVWTSTFFIKEASSPTFAAWHQDSTYFGLDPYEQVTAWVALTDASQDAGCIEVLSAHGKPRQMRHVPKKLANSINRTGQTITEPLDESNVRAMPLKAGQFSLHHTLCVHRSAPNNTPQRRVAKSGTAIQIANHFSISFVPERCHAHTHYIRNHEEQNGSNRQYPQREPMQAWNGRKRHERESEKQRIADAAQPPTGELQRIQPKMQAPTLTRKRLSPERH